MTYYCIGIKGTGMSTLAQMLSDLGNQVYGYDDQKEEKFTEKGLKERKIPIYYDQSFPLTKDVIVTASKAFSDQHREIKRVKESAATFQNYNEIVGSITRQFDTISICGTHGKTTTTSLLKHLFETTIGTNYFIGDGSGKVSSKVPLLVIEADEFNRHFLAYQQNLAIVTCIELEHTEIYHDLEDVVKTFETFCNQNTKEKVIANGDDENVRKIAFQTPVLFYGEKEENDYVIKNIALETTGSSFDLYHQGEKLGHFKVPLYGHHMVMNTGAAIIAAMDKGLSPSTIQASLLTFQNATRRFQETIINGHIIIDDYAHHPTEVKVTLEAIRQKYPDKRLVVVFRPNTYSRTAAFHKEFSEALQVADQAYVTPILCDREDPKEYGNVSSEMILCDLPNGELIDEESISKLEKEKDSVVAFMGCATVSHLIEGYRNLLES